MNQKKILMKYHHIVSRQSDIETEKEMLPQTF